MLSGAGEGRHSLGMLGDDLWLSAAIGDMTEAIVGT